ncbi:MAG: PD-(D/E)XK nuclease family protein [Acidobacteriota bacterium]
MSEPFKIEMNRILATFKFIDLSHVPAEGLLVLTPNREAAARLKAPHRSLRSLADAILNREKIAVASPLHCLHALKTVIRKLTPERDAAAEAARIRRILATVLRDGIDIAALKRSGVPSAESLGKIAEAYLLDLSNSGLVDPESALLKAGDFVRERHKVLVYGYFRAREHDIRFIDKIAGEGSVFVVPSGDGSVFTSVNRSIDELLNSGWQIEDRDRDSVSEIEKAAYGFVVGNAKDNVADDTISALAYANVDAEVRGTLASAKRMITEGIRPEEIAIVCRKASHYEQTISTIAGEYGVPVSSRSTMRLLETTLGAYISLILESNENAFEFAVTARLLNHKYGPGLSDEIWSTARRRRSSGIDGWKEAGVDLAPIVGPESLSLTEWIDWLARAIPSSLVRERAPEIAGELIAYERFRDALAELKTFDDKQQIDLAVFSKVLAEMLENVETEIEPRNGGIPFHQPNTIIGGAFRHIFVLGMAEGMLPAVTREDAAIDFYEQRILEQRSVRFDKPVEFPRWEALSFYYVLLAARSGITLSYPKTIDIEEKIASPFFDRLPVKLEKAGITSVASPREELKYFLRHHDAPERLRLLKPAKHQYSVERQRESDQAYDEYDGLTGIPIDIVSRTWSASQLTKIGQCPFKWFSEKVLRLSPTEEGDTDLRGNTMGRLYHKTLQIAVGKALESPTFRETVLAVLEQAFLEAENDDEIGVKGLPNWEHRRSEHLATLRKAVESPDFIAEGARAVATEQKFEASWNGFNLRGSIDRVDATPDGFVAIDYKTGTYVGKVKDATGELETDIQLPIYTRVALESLYPGRVADGHYFSLRQTKIMRQKPAEIESFAAGVKKILEAGNFSVDPDGKKKSCKYCEYDPLCRRGPRNARKPKP